MRWAAAWLGAALGMAALDSIWLTLAADRLYRPRIGAIMLDEGFRLAPALAFYAIYVFGVVLFAVAPTAAASWRNTALRGALLGLVCYATYDLTNQATLAVWSTTVTLADIAWGVVLTCAAALSGRLGLRLAGAKVTGG
jgi:uncharacterized membrane protein